MVEYLDDWVDAENLKQKPKLYYKEKGIRLYKGNSNFLSFEDNSIDCALTDPPYGINFMGKKWDYDVPSVEQWKEILRVLKPGGVILVFAGTRTQHRMACNIEDAGFVLKDCVMWLYGCLSEDTEILTESGWKHLYKIVKYDRIRIYDITNNIYKWETPERWTVYSVNKDTCYRIKSNTTDQIVSKEHRCLVEREGELIFKQAWELDEMEKMPVLPSNFHYKKKSNRELLFKKLLWESKRLAQTLFGKWQGEKESQKGIKNGKKSSVEGWCNLFPEKRKLWQIQNKICLLPKRILGYGSERRLRYGTSFISGSKFGQMFNVKRSSTSYRPQSRKQQDRKSNVVCKQQRPQITRSTISKIEYTGKLFCPTVSTGAFVARRNGLIFITGNSGFPKSLDISKAIDKKFGAKREVVGKSLSGGFKRMMINNKEQKFRPKDYYEDGNKFTSNQPITPEAKLWDGYGTALKPAYEPIIVAMKPNEGTYAENALKWGVAGLNIDGSRVLVNPEIDDMLRKVNRNKRQTEVWEKGSGFKNEENSLTGVREKGRFPANIIHDGSEEVLESFPVTKSGATKREIGSYKGKSNTGFLRGESNPSNQHGDSGSVARFFYCAKVSKKERGEDNNHPTVKPLALMRYLLKLIKPPTGGVVLDPFAGSGSTLIACKQAKRKVIGIELEEEYCKIAVKRLKGV